MFNYEEYISPDVLAAFEEEFGVTVEVTTFTSMDEAIAKLGVGRHASSTCSSPTADVIGKVAAGNLLQPLNKTYLPNIANVWESLQDPFYDKGGVVHGPVHALLHRHRLPRRPWSKSPDMFDNPYDIFWDPANHG